MIFGPVIFTGISRIMGEVVPIPADFGRCRSIGEEQSGLVTSQSKLHVDKQPFTLTFTPKSNLGHVFGNVSGNQST